MYLIIFCFSLFAGIAVFKNNQPIAMIPRLPKGTIGLRSFGCEVVFSEIEISYLDSNGIWQMIPTEVTNEKNNWKHAFKVYNDIKNWEPPGVGNSSWNYSKHKKDSLIITLNNSGVKFNPANHDVAKYLKNAEYFKVSTVVKVDTSYAQYADIQICMNVTPKSDEESEELYLGFSLPVKDINNAKFWIPALVWRIGNEYRDPISELNKNGIYDDLSYGVEYNFIAVSFFNTARIYLKNMGGASIICESKFESSK